jgi:hypothetical protein
MELPRVLQVQQFTAAREPEVRSGNAGALTRGLNSLSPY